MDLQDFALFVLALVGGAAGVVSLVNGLKQRLGWSGANAVILAAVVSTVTAVLIMWSEGQLLPGTGQATWGNLLQVIIAVLGNAQIIYKRFEVE